MMQVQDNKTRFEIQPLEGYQEYLQELNNFESFKSIHINKLQAWFDKFPLCCDNHRDLINETWFNKSDYDYVIDKIFNQYIYTIHCIKTSINKADWYDLITEYLADNLASFGAFEDSYYGNCGGSQYFYWVKFQIEKIIEDEKKRTDLLLFLDDSEYVESINKIRDFIGEIVPTNHDIFFPLMVEFNKKIDSLLLWKESRYTHRYNWERPQTSKIEGEIMKFTDSMVKNYNLEWAYNNGMIQNKNDILNRILFHQDRLSKKEYETNSHKWLKDEMFKWLQILYTIINSLHIDCFPESNPIMKPKGIGKGKAGRPPKDESSKKWEEDLFKNFQRLTKTNDNIIKKSTAKERLVNVTFKDKFNQKSNLKSKIARLNTILRKFTNNN